MTRELPEVQDVRFTISWMMVLRSGVLEAVLAVFVVQAGMEFQATDDAVLGRLAMSLVAVVKVPGLSAAWPKKVTLVAPV